MSSLCHNWYPCPMQRWVHLTNTLCVAASLPWKSFKLWEIKPSLWCGHLQSHCTDSHTSQRMGPTLSLQNQGPHWDPVHQVAVAFVLMKHSLNCCEPFTIFHSSGEIVSGGFASFSVLLWGWGGGPLESPFLMFSNVTISRHSLESPFEGICWYLSEFKISKHSDLEVPLLGI